MTDGSDPRNCIVPLSCSTHVPNLWIWVMILHSFSREWNVTTVHSLSHCSQEGPDKEQALDRRINEIKQQNKAIMRRDKEIRKDKELYS